VGTEAVTELRRLWIREAAVADAARRYLDATRDLAPQRYEQLEPEAWARLLTALERLGRPVRS
jgi:hypothetical protein